MAIVFFVFVLSIVSILAFFFMRTRRSKHSKVVGFFHPYTNDGGGGERVLWCAMKAIQELLPDFDCVVYTGDPATSDGLAARALDRFGVRLISAPKVIKLERRKWVEASLYPHFTLLGQSLGSVMLVWEALSKLTPALFFDTSGYAFTYPVAKGFGCTVVCYTHYPTISSDMIRRVVGGASMYNNSRLIAKSWLLSSAKALYYRVMASIYGLAGRYSDLTLVNSSWTQAHIEKIWGVPVVRVYPPCDTTSLQEFPLRRVGSECYFVSVAQFRPEKAHELQLEAFAVALEKIKAYKQQSNAQVTSPKLKLIGSCRNDEDLRRLQDLRCKAHELGIADLVDFCENVSYEKLVNLLGGAVAGIHSMTDEHFGISIVEYMAAGAIPIAHNSAGPKQDIVVEENGQKTGFLASTVDEFADAMCLVVLMEEDKRMQIAKMARQRSTQFSCERFEKDFKAAIRRYLILPVLIPS